MHHIKNRIDNSPLGRTALSLSRNLRGCFQKSKLGWSSQKSQLKMPTISSCTKFNFKEDCRQFPEKKIKMLRPCTFRKTLGMKLKRCMHSYMKLNKVCKCMPRPIIDSITFKGS